MSGAYAATRMKADIIVIYILGAVANGPGTDRFQRGGGSNTTLLKIAFRENVCVCVSIVDPILGLGHFEL